MREDRLEVELRAALHREMDMARLGVTASQIRTGIAARERGRRWTRAAAGIAAAFAVVLLGAPVLAQLAQRVLAPDQPTETAVTVRLEAAGDLVVEKTPFAGSAVEMARLPRAADWLRPTVDPARLQPGTTGTVVAFHPDGYLAVAVSAADGARRPVAILAWDLARPADDPTRIDATTDLWGTPLIGWTPDGRLVVATDREASAFDVLDARTRRVVRVTLPGGGAALVRWTDNFVAGGSITSTPDSRVVVVGINDRGTFRYTMATVELPRDGGVATLTDGLPQAVWSVTGLERLWGVNAGGVVALTGSSWRPLNHTAKGHWLPTAGVKVIRRYLNSDLRDGQTWAILGPGEQLVGVPAWDASGAGVWLLQGTGRRLDLVHLDGPGLASVRATIPWDGTTGSDRNAIAGVASDGRGLIVYRATGDLFVDGVSGRWAELPAGARFVGWARAATTAIPDERPFCAPAQDGNLAGTRIGGPGEPFVAGLPGGVGGTVYASPRPAAHAAGMAAARTFVGAGLRLVLPDGACPFSVAAEAVPVDDAGATPLEIDSSNVTPGGPGGMLGLAEPPVGRWIVRVRLALLGSTAGSVASLLFRVDVTTIGPAPSAGASPGGRLVFDAPPAGSLPYRVIPTWTAEHGGADSPADGVTTFGGPASRPLRAGPVVASVACTGHGSILVAATTAGTAPPADRWTPVACAGLPRDTTPIAVDLPDARGGETVLLVERRPTHADDLLGYSVVVGQPVDVACDTPTPDLVARIGLRSSPDGAPEAGALVAYELPAGSRAMAARELAAAGSLPAPVGSRGTVDGPWSLALPAGLCATGWTLQQAAAGATSLGPDSYSQYGDYPVVDAMSLSLNDIGDWVISVTLTLPGPGGVTGSATLLWHVQVLERATSDP